MSGATYVNVVDTAKEIRIALARNFPDQKFSVRSKSYSGGASVSVGWSNGPSYQAVDRIVQRYAGADFDGMTDSKSSVTTILMDAEGKTRKVRWGADYVFCNRSTSIELEAAIVAVLRGKLNLGAGVPDWRVDAEYQRIARRCISSEAIDAGEPVESVAARLVAKYLEVGEVEA